jgi:hypothetical protein
VKPPAGGQYISLARFSLAQLLMQSDLSSAKLTAAKGQTKRNNSVIMNLCIMNSHWLLLSLQVGIFIFQHTADVLQRRYLLKTTIAKKHFYGSNQFAACIKTADKMFSPGV